MAPSFYPVKERLVDGFEGGALLVDVGGSVGHDLDEFHKYHPDAPGELVLQDLAAVIADAKDLDPAIKAMEYDFHDEQPVKGECFPPCLVSRTTPKETVTNMEEGARAYYLHSVLHDWPDNVCQTILGRIKEAMRPGYSKILINENCIPLQGAWFETTGLDMTMLSLFSSKERTEADWYNLVEGMAGLKIVKIWGAGRGVESLIEVELP